jgi:hypothetical protein
MANDKIYNDPTNRVVCVFDSYAKAIEAIAALIEFGFEKQQIRLLRGHDDAAEIDTSPKWFADTDTEMKRIERQLLAGDTIVAVPVHDSDGREEVHRIVTAHGAKHVTHFGEWVTEVLR